MTLLQGSIHTRVDYSSGTRLRTYAPGHARNRQFEFFSHERESLWAGLRESKTVRPESDSGRITNG